MPNKLSASLTDYGLRITNNEITDSIVTGIEVGDNFNGTVIEHNVVRQETAGDLTGFAIRHGSGTSLCIRNNRVVSCGSSTMAVDLSPSAEGRFEGNEHIGSTAPADTNPGTVLERTLSIADDAVVSMNMQGNRWRVECFGSRSPTNGLAWFLSAGPTAVAKEGHANFQTSTSVLNGTTGTDGNFTVSYTGGNMYFENRTGATAAVQVRITIQ